MQRFEAQSWLTAERTWFVYSESGRYELRDSPETGLRWFAQTTENKCPALWQINCNILVARIFQEDTMTAMGCHDWKQLAEAARDEQDPEKLMDLIQCLNRALGEHMKGLYPRSSEAAG